MRAWKLEYLSSLAHREWWQENGDAVWKAFLLYVCGEADILIGWDVLLYIFVMILIYEWIQGMNSISYEINLV